MKRRWAVVVPGVVAVLCAGVAVLSKAADEKAGKATQDNLQAAFTGESIAKAKYEAFAVKADGEGYKSVAALFRAVAKSEGIHATKHAAMIKKLTGADPAAPDMKPPDVKSTKENLEASVKGETEEGESMYPKYVKQAEEDKNPGAAMSFKGAMASEASHAKLFKQALSELDNWKAEGKVFAVCQICGFTLMGAAPQKCPVCAAPSTKFDVVK